MGKLEKILENSIGEGKPVSGDLLPLIYDELRSLAARKLMKGHPQQTIQATALVHEAWMRLGGDEEKSWNDRAHFFRTAALAMRNILVDRARRKARREGAGSSAPRRGGANAEYIQIDELPVAVRSQDERVLLVNEVLERLETEHPERAQVVSLKFFGGLTNKEIAAMNGVTERTIERYWAFAKARLYELIRDEGED